MNEAVERATRLIAIIHRSIDWGAWGSKRLTYWGTLENAIKAAAYTVDLGRFLAALCQKMGIAAPGRNKEDRTAISEILNVGKDREILTVLREQTALIVVQVRVEAEERKNNAETELSF